MKIDIIENIGLICNEILRIEIYIKISDGFMLLSLESEARNRNIFCVD